MHIASCLGRMQIVEWRSLIASSKKIRISPGVERSITPARNDPCASITAWICATKVISRMRSVTDAAIGHHLTDVEDKSEFNRFLRGSSRGCIGRSAYDHYRALSGAFVLWLWRAQSLYGIPYQANARD